MSPDRVRRVFGRPDRIRRSRESGTPTRLSYWVYRRRGLTALFRHVKRPRLSGVSTTSRRYRTASGVGVGSTEEQVRAGVEGIECHPVDDDRWCTLGSGWPRDKPQTIFDLGRNRVTEVRILLTWP